MITDAQARVIAMAWHSGQSSSLYSLGSTGCIDDGVEQEIGEDMDACKSINDSSDLANLLDYIQHHGERGRQDGGHLLWDDDYENGMNHE